MTTLPEINLIISEPFEFPLNSTTAVIQERSGPKILLGLYKEIEYKNTIIKQFIASPRGEGESFDSLDDGKKVVVNLVPISSAEELSIKEALQFASSWRGWFSIGTIERKI